MQETTQNALDTANASVRSSERVSRAAIGAMQHVSSQAIDAVRQVSSQAIDANRQTSAAAIESSRLQHKEMADVAKLSLHYNGLMVCALSK